MFKLYLRKATIILSCLFFSTTWSFAQQPVLSLTPVINGLNLPMQLVNAGDGTNRIFIVEQAGTIRVYDQSLAPLGMFLTVSGVGVGGERGLLSLAFPPDYETTGFFYVYYTNTIGDLELARYHISADPNVADPLSKKIVLTIPHSTNDNHNGGALHFGNDGYLYFATGDGGGAGDVPNNAQNGTILLGKMLRIAVNTATDPPFYTVPPTNPFISAVDTLHEIWAFGLRNPFRWDFDKATNDMWIGDVGQSSREEINYRADGSTGGINYGWRCYEGNVSFNTGGCAPIGNYIFPIFDYPNPNGSSSPSSAVTGGTVYRGTLPVNAPLQGFYLASDFYSGNIYMIRPNGSGGWTTYLQPAALIGITNFGDLENGELYITSLTAGSLFRITVTGILPVTLIEFTALPVDQNVRLLWKTSSEQNLQQFEIEYSLDGNNFIRAGIVAANNSVTGGDYTFTHRPPSSDRVFYRLKMIDFDSRFKYSETVTIRTAIANDQFVQPSVITGGVMNIFLNRIFKTIELIGANGSIILKQHIGGRAGRIDIAIPFVSPGVYFVRLQNEEVVLRQKVIIR